MVSNHSKPQGVPRQAQNIEICAERKIPAQVPRSVTNELHQSLIFSFGIGFSSSLQPTSLKGPQEAQTNDTNTAEASELVKKAADLL